MKKTALLIALFALLVLAVLPAAAQIERTITVTEAQINGTFAVTNPRNRALTDMVVDLQPNQVSIGATYNVRGRTPTAYPVTAILTPTISNGRVNWAVTSVTVDAENVSQSLINQINAQIESSWRRYISSTAPSGRITAIAITDAAITWTYTAR